MITNTSILLFVALMLFESNRNEHGRRVLFSNFCQAHSQTMNTVGAAASSAGAYMYLHKFIYCIILIYTVYIYYVYVSIKCPFVRTISSAI